MFFLGILLEDADQAERDAMLAVIHSPGPPGGPPNSLPDIPKIDPRIGRLDI
jgi:hypothetical protein